MVEVIGQTAGDVWKYLNEKGETTAAKLKKDLKVDNNLLNQAIGWLAREGKIRIKKDKQSLKLSLK